jgi:hypothetical protein
MARIDQLRYDDQVPGRTVALGPDGEVVDKAAAIAEAHRRGQHLVAEWSGDEDEPVSCSYQRLALPPRWELLPTEPVDPDPELWFEAWCPEGRDLIVPVGGHTFPGRMLAHCPHQDVRFHVSKSEMTAMAEATRWYVTGYLAAAEPEVPDHDDDLPDEDLVAWQSAVDRFRRTGAWRGRWRTCEVCGCVLLPDGGDGARCHDHAVTG